MKLERVATFDEPDDILDLGSWCILRMTATETLPVFESLRRAGFTVWTPVEEKVRRFPRSKARHEKKFAMMPTYVFARAEHVTQLAELAMTPTKKHPDFRMFRHMGGLPLISDDELDSLRSVEAHTARIAERARQKGRKAPRIATGTLIQLEEGGFAGMPGTVIGSEGQFTLVDFENFPQPVKISSLLLFESMQCEDENLDKRALRHRNAA